MGGELNKGKNTRRQGSKGLMEAGYHNEVMNCEDLVGTPAFFYLNLLKFSEVVFTMH